MISIKLFENYDAWLVNRFLELGATFTALTIRDSMTINEGLVQIYDDKNLHVGLTGNEIIQISMDSKVGPINRIYGIKHNAISIDSKADSIMTFNLISLHKLKRTKFSRVFYPDAKDSIQEMITVLYQDSPLLQPEINGMEIHIPKVPWVQEYQDYINFVKEHGVSRTNDSFPFVWEDIRGINIYDHETLKNRTPINFIHGEPSIAGEYIDQLEYPVAFDIEYLTKNNPYVRNAFSNCTYYAHSFLDKDATRIITGDGHNSVMISRSGGYAEQQYRNGYEEYIRLHTMSQYDSYIRFTTQGDFELTPGLKVHIYDQKNQFLTDMFIDDVVHEATQDESYTYVYCFASSYVSDNINEIKTVVDLEDIESVEIITAESDINLRDDKGNINYSLELSDTYKLENLTTKTAAGGHKLKAQNNLNINQIVSNLKNISINVLEPIKKQYPNMIVTSGFRVGLGSSQHLKGEAVDMQFTGVSKKEYYDISKWIQSNIPHDQLLLEFKTTGTKNPWIHVSLKRTKQRSMTLTMMNHSVKHTGLVQLA